MHSLIKYIDLLRNATGWKRAAFAFLFGSLMALAMPPFNLFPLLWICFPILIFLLQGTQNWKQAFTVGWSFSFGFFVFGLYWIAASMFVDIARFWWAVPFSVAGLPAFFALYYGLAAVLARRLGTQGVSGAFITGLLWFLADYARGHVLTGFPWNLIGYAFSGVLPVMQSISIFGIYGLTLLTCITACLPASLADQTKSARILFVTSIALFIAIAASGEMRLHKTDIGTVPNVRVRLVQPNISQTLKWRPNERENNFQTMIDLTSAPAEKPITHIFWPETASVYYLSEDTVARKEIAAHMPPSSTLITGVIRRDPDEEDVIHFYNSLVAMDGLGHLVAGYDKAHLVPFGEFMPLRKYNPLPALAVSSVDFSAGSGARSLRVLGLPLFSPLICYEVIFPGMVVDENDRPDFMVNLTNDGWYGNTTGPYQHFAIARARSIEEGLPLLRIANTGISGIVDPVGRVVKQLGLGKQGFIDSDLPTSLPPTFFARYGEIPLWIVFLAACLQPAWAKGLRKCRGLKT